MKILTKQLSDSSKFYFYKNIVSVSDGKGNYSRLYAHYIKMVNDIIINQTK
jgi:hypothetical protein